MPPAPSLSSTVYRPIKSPFAFAWPIAPALIGRQPSRRHQLLPEFPTIARRSRLHDFREEPPSSAPSSSPRSSTTEINLSTLIQSSSSPDSRRRFSAGSGVCPGPAATGLQRPEPPGRVAFVRGDVSDGRVEAGLNDLITGGSRASVTSRAGFIRGIRRSFRSANRTLSRIGGHGKDPGARRRSRPIGRGAEARAASAWPGRYCRKTITAGKADGPTFDARGYAISLGPSVCGQTRGKSACSAVAQPQVDHGAKAPPVTLEKCLGVKP